MVYGTVNVDDHKHNKNAFQMDAYRPLADRIPEYRGGMYPSMHYIGGVYPGMHWECVCPGEVCGRQPPMWTDRHL